MRSEYLTIKHDLELIRQANIAEAASNPRLASVIATHLNPPLTEDSVATFEDEHAIKLPADYRDFILSVANGGIGPVGGLERLGQFNSTDWDELPGLVGDLVTPFPYTTRWNAAPIDASLPIAEQYMQQDWYWSAEHVTGAIPICDLGSGLRQLLIVSGPERGHVWFDDRADWQGLYPDSRGDNPRVSFFQWYRKWADSKLSKSGRA